MNLVRNEHHEQSIVSNLIGLFIITMGVTVWRSPIHNVWSMWWNNVTVTATPTADTSSSYTSYCVLSSSLYTCADPVSTKVKKS